MTQPSVPLHKWGLKSRQIQQLNAKGHSPPVESPRFPAELPEAMPWTPEQTFRARSFPERYEIGWVNRSYKRTSVLITICMLSRIWPMAGFHCHLEHRCGERDINSLVSGLQRPPPISRVLKCQTGLGAVCSHPTKSEGARPECGDRSISSEAHGPTTS